ncbi:hypothetical protein J6590_024900 [Homalodisca vitripennis]|nr:hypothetical protein J6590_024900 [Homalodisca vitripennis]
MFALGAVLSQGINGEEHSVAYRSRALFPAEKNYSATERELLSLELDDQLGTLGVKEYSLEGTVQLLRSHYHRRMVIKYAIFGGTSLVVVLIAVVLLLRWRVRVADLLRAEIADSIRRPPRQSRFSRRSRRLYALFLDQSGSMSTPRTTTDCKVIGRGVESLALGTLSKCEIS